MRFVPADPIRYAAPSSTIDAAQLQHLSALATVAVEVAAGVRPLKHLRPQNYSFAVLTHIKAWRKDTGTNKRRSRAQILSLHGRSDGEVFGTALIGQSQHAFTGHYSESTLGTFRIL